MNQQNHYSTSIAQPRCDLFLLALVRFNEAKLPRDDTGGAEFARFWSCQNKLYERHTYFTRHFPNHTAGALQIVERD